MLKTTPGKVLSVMESPAVWALTKQNECPLSFAADIERMFYSSSRQASTVIGKNFPRACRIVRARVSFFIDWDAWAGTLKGESSLAPPGTRPISRRKRMGFTQERGSVIAQG